LRALIHPPCSSDAVKLDASALADFLAAEMVCFFSKWLHQTSHFEKEE